MVNIGNLTLIGSSHISPESVKEVKTTILEIKPEFVAIELDKGRLLALLGKKRKLKLKDIRQIGVGGFMFAMLGSWFEEKLGKMVGTKPGSEMKVAVVGAAKIGAKVALIDQEIKVTLQKLLKTITWREKFRFVSDLIKGLVTRKAQIEGLEDFDLRKVPGDELIEKMVAVVKERYPSFYKVLIEDRNKYMVNKLKKIMDINPDKKIVAVVGAGHVKGMIYLLEN